MKQPPATTTAALGAGGKRSPRTPLLRQCLFFYFRLALKINARGGRETENLIIGHSSSDRRVGRQDRESWNAHKAKGDVVMIRLSFNLKKFYVIVRFFKLEKKAEGFTHVRKLGHLQVFSRYLAKSSNFYLIRTPNQPHREPCTGPSERKLCDNRSFFNSFKRSASIHMTGPSHAACNNAMGNVFYTSTSDAIAMQPATRQRAQVRDLSSMHAPMFGLRACLNFFGQGSKIKRKKTTIEYFIRKTNKKRRDWSELGLSGKSRLELKLDCTSCTRWAQVNFFWKLALNFTRSRTGRSHLVRE